jgi:DNA-binding response OmpR family regulator
MITVSLRPVNPVPTRRRILVVDDDPYLRMLVSAALPDSDLVEAWRLSDALAIALEQTPDAVIVDRMLPDGDGLELVRQFRADPTLMSVPIVFLTATHDESTRHDVLIAGADEYLTKTRELADIESIPLRLERLYALDAAGRLTRRSQLAARAAAGELGDLEPIAPPPPEQTPPKRRWFRRD